MQLLLGLLAGVLRMLGDELYSAAVQPPPASYNALLEYGKGCPAFETVFSQGGCGACVAFAVATASGMRSCKRGENVLVSPYRVFDCSAKSGCDEGSTIYHTSLTMERGVSALNETAPHFGLRCAEGPHKASQYAVFGITSIKRELMRNGPVTFTVWGTSELHSLGKGEVYPSKPPSVSDTDSNWHEIVIYGWIDSSETEPVGAWLVQNSWSDDWCDGGRGRVAYGPYDVVTAFDPL